MLYGIMLKLHLLSVTVWVGGMFFAYMALRPVAASQLEPPVWLTLWAGVFARFFPWVWLAIILILTSGLHLFFAIFKGWQGASLNIQAMLILGVIMMLIYMHVFFAPYKRLKRAVGSQDWPAGGKALAQIRLLVGINLIIGLIVIAVAAGGRYMI